MKKNKEIFEKDVLFYCLSSSTSRHASCMKIVLTMGATLDNKTKDGTPIFVEACKNANEFKDMCLMLMDEGVDPNSCDEVFNNHISIIYLLDFKGLFFFENIGK